LNTSRQTRKTYRCRLGPVQMELGHITRILGIVNVTPDSFSGDGCLSAPKNTREKALRQALRMVRQGADIIDIGGESTRPGSKKVSAQTEKARIIPVISALAKRSKVPISADTYKSSVAKQALDAGAAIINNIKGVRAERSLLRMVRNYDAAIVLMHIQGSPRTMQKRIHYRDMIQDICDSLGKSIEICLEIGIKSDRIIIDPGIGFGKTLEHNLEIIQRLSRFNCLHKPILIGTSRKSLIGNILNAVPQQRKWGTAATVCAGIMNGAHIVRVHDVKEMKDVAMMTDAILNVNSR